MKSAIPIRNKNLPIQNKAKEVSQYNKAFVNALKFENSLQDKIEELSHGIDNRKSLLLEAALNNSKKLTRSSKKFFEKSLAELNEMTKQSVSRHRANKLRTSFHPPKARPSLVKNDESWRTKGLWNDPKFYKMFYERPVRDEKEIKRYKELLGEAEQNLRDIIKKERLAVMQLENARKRKNEIQKSKDAKASEVAKATSNLIKSMQEHDVVFAEKNAIVEEVRDYRKALTELGVKLPAPFWDWNANVANISIHQPNEVQTSPITHVNPQLIAELSSLTSKFNHTLKATEESIQNMAFELEEKKVELNQDFKRLHKLNDFKKHANEQNELQRVVNKINQLKFKLREEQQAVKALKTNLFMNMKKVSKHFNKLDSETQEIIKEYSGSRIPKIGTNLRSTLSKVSMIEREARKSIKNLIELREEQIKHMNAYQVNINRIQQDINQSIGGLEVEVLRAQMNDLKGVFGKYSTRLKKINEKLMQLCTNILFRHKNLIYSQAFKNDVKTIYLELKRSGVRQSKIAITVRYPMKIAPIPGICMFF